MDMEVYRPSKPEQGKGYDDCTNVGQGKTKLGFCNTLVAFCEDVVDGVNPRDQEPNCDEEAYARTQVQKPNNCGRIAISTAPDFLKIGIERISRTKESSLIGSHGEHDRLGEENADRSLRRLPQLRAQRPVVFALETILVRRGVFVFVAGFAGRENGGCVGFLEEEEAEDGVGRAHYGEDPEYPAPV